MVGLSARAASSIAVRIQHHPSRAGLPRRLIGYLGAFEDVQVIEDPRPDGGTDSWRSHRACLESMTPDAPHLLVLQDDALPTEGFATKLCQAVEQHNDAVLVLFTPGFAYLRKQLLEAQTAHAAVTPLRPGAFVPAVAILYPRAFVEALLGWANTTWNDRQKRQLRGADDGVIAMYCRHARIQPLLLVPSIVEHDDSIDSVGKFHRRTGPHRRAALLDSP